MFPDLAPPEQTARPPIAAGRSANPGAGTISDNGTRVVTDYDQANAFAWNQHIQTFNAAGTLIGDVYV